MPVQLYISGDVPSWVATDYPQFKVCHFTGSNLIDPSLEWSDPMTRRRLKGYLYGIPEDTDLPIMLDREDQFIDDLQRGVGGARGEEVRRWIRRCTVAAQNMRPKSVIGWYGLPIHENYYAPGTPERHATSNAWAMQLASAFMGLERPVCWMPSLYDIGVADTGDPASSVAYYIEQAFDTLARIRDFVYPRCLVMPTIGDRHYHHAGVDPTAIPPIEDDDFLRDWFDFMAQDDFVPDGYIYWNKSFYFENNINPTGAAARAEARQRATMDLMLEVFGEIPASTPIIPEPPAKGETCPDRPTDDDTTLVDAIDLETGVFDEDGIRIEVDADTHDGSCINGENAPAAANVTSFDLANSILRGTNYGIYIGQLAGDFTLSNVVIESDGGGNDYNCRINFSGHGECNIGCSSFTNNRLNKAVGRFYGYDGGTWHDNVWTGRRMMFGGGASSEWVSHVESQNLTINGDVFDVDKIEIYPNTHDHEFNDCVFHGPITLWGVGDDPSELPAMYASNIAFNNCIGSDGLALSLSNPLHFKDAANVATNAVAAGITV